MLAELFRVLREAVKGAGPVFFWLQVSWGELAAGQEGQSPCRLHYPLDAARRCFYASFRAEGWTAAWGSGPARKVRTP